MAAEQVDFEYTSSQDQTGNTTKLKGNHPEKPTKDQLKGNPITKDLQKMTQGWQEG